jgi:hypothetical protein
LHRAFSIEQTHTTSKTLRKPVLLVSFVAFSISWAFSQYEDMAKVRLNEALKERIVNLSPPKGCACNACKFNYAEAMKIEKTRTFQGKLLIWGKAKVKYKSSFEGAGTKSVTFYAELQKRDGQVFVTRLKWQTDQCMKLTDIM